MVKSERSRLEAREREPKNYVHKWQFSSFVCVNSLTVLFFLYKCFGKSLIHFVYFLVYTLDGNAKNAPCVFPYIFENKTYRECTYDGCKHGKTWCATTDNYDKDKKWGHCQTDEEAPDCMDVHSNCGEWALHGECLTNPSYMRNSCPRSCGICTFGGNGRGRACTFPFFFKNRLVYDCMSFNKKKWCAVTVNYNKDKRWGYCLPKCKQLTISSMIYSYSL